MSGLDTELLPRRYPVFIGLGSNLDDPKQQLRQAFSELKQLPHTDLVRHSQLYRSDPVGPEGQPDYINAVAQLSTQLRPEALLDQLQALEQAHRRIRQQHWGPRTLDLDILLFGNLQLDSPRLTIPHPHMTERSFVLHPLKEIAPSLVFLDGRTIHTLVVQCDMASPDPLGV